MIKVVIDSVKVSLLTNHRLVVLREENRDRCLMLWLSACDADAFAIQLNKAPLPRPLTYNFFFQFMRQTNLSVERVYIHSLIDKLLRVQVIAARRELGMRRSLVVDCRLGDGLLTAAHFEVPIYVSSPIMEKLSHPIDELPSKDMDLAAWEAVTASEPKPPAASSPDAKAT